jgi:hypothetical protein
MWVHDEPGSIFILPFDHCMDEHDSLAVFRYRDPRMLSELINRRMVEDISEVSEQVHQIQARAALLHRDTRRTPVMRSLPRGGDGRVTPLAGKGGTSKRGLAQGSVAVEETSSGRGDDISSRLVRLAKVPKNEKMLKEASVRPLVHLATSTVRTFELICSSRRTHVLLSAETVEDMKSYGASLSMGIRRHEVRESRTVPRLSARVARKLRDGISNSFI